MKCTNPIRITFKGPQKIGKMISRKGTFGNGVYVDVPCGRCLACRSNRAYEWSVRMMLEGLYWDSSLFITLTYSDEYLPLDGSLVKPDLQKYIKRLRRELQPRKIKYYAVGEYGSKSGRPHYHLIVFGLSFADEEVVKDCWKFGMVDIGTVTVQSTRYVAGYVQKKLYGEPAKDIYGDCLPPFSLMSQGLGKRYALQFKDKILKDGITFDGQHVSVPRYFLKKICEDDPLVESQRLQRLKGFTKAEIRRWSTIGVTESQIPTKYLEIADQQTLNSLARRNLFSKDKL